MLLIRSILENAADATPDAVAATVGDQALTFGEIEQGGNYIAHSMQATGIGRGDRVLWWGDTSLEAVPVFAGAAKIGAVFAPLNARASLEEILPVAEYARASVVLSSTSHARQAVELAGRLGIPHELREPDTRRTGNRRPDIQLDENDPHVIFFTSGSTGRPKGVVLSNRVNWLRTFVGGTTSPGGGGVVCMFPLFHMAGWTIALGAWHARRAVHFVTVPDAATLLSTTERFRASRLYCIPAVWGRILQHGLEGYDLSSLVEADTGTSATPPELLAAIKAALPDTVTRVFYGSTEAGPTLSLPDVDLARKPGSCGIAQPGVEIRVDERGEVCARSPFLMDGYFDDPDSTAEALVDGWYHSGDLGVMDDEGYVSIVGRARDVIRTGGETVAPPEVEAVLGDHPAVLEVAVVGVPDTEWGEVITAVLVLRPGAETVTVESLRTFCADRLSSFKHPRRIAIVDALPRTAATGQIQRPLIVENLQQG